ncbi:hypothetical protein PANT111_90173 [Pantoea brenneri]|uniref:Uncharacterized protein n=1 Tax=Pantoea brenneri TaxID=472694 RepID=A0AAX3JD77_9GAMM|nr:hypothetical protein PANT111_90173 [Pantoea brenneri]
MFLSISTMNVDQARRQAASSNRSRACKRLVNMKKSEGLIRQEVKIRAVTAGSPPGDQDLSAGSVTQ